MKLHLEKNMRDRQGAEQGCTAWNENGARGGGNPGLNETQLTTPSLTRVGGSTSVFTLPWDSRFLTEVNSLPEFFIEMWAYPY